MARLKITYVGGQAEEVAVTPRAEVEVERKFNISFRDFATMEHYYYAAWWASGRKSGEFESFLDSLDSVTTATEGAASDPTQTPPPSHDSSD